jgi:hypothetical protein
MSEDTYLARARCWRQKAEEIRTFAHQMQIPFSRQSFARMAETYDRLAEEYENKATGHTTPKPTLGRSSLNRARTRFWPRCLLFAEAESLIAR